MKLHISYGRKGQTVELPDENLEILFPGPAIKIHDIPGSVQKAIVEPIGCSSLLEIAQNRKSAVIVISDITRPVPNKQILPPILKTLEEAGINDLDIKILIATGIHQPNEGKELEELLGSEIPNRYNCINHIATDPKTNRSIGKTRSGIPVELDIHYLDSDLKILTGLVEPHLLAGFSGGRKSILPGLASLETMKRLHGYKMIQRDCLRNGLLIGNPFHEEAIEIARKAGVDFILNVSVDEKRNLTGIFAGDLENAHEIACKQVQHHAFIPIDELFDIVVTTGGGDPLDRTLYQSLKGVVGALEAVKPGGTIILAAEMGQGLGSTEFKALVDRIKEPEEFTKLCLESDFISRDQWMYQELINALHHCKILCCTKGISKDEIGKCFMEPVESVEDGIQIARSIHGQDSAILAIPQGPYTIPRPQQLKKGLYSWVFQKGSE